MSQNTASSQQPSARKPSIWVTTVPELINYLVLILSFGLLGFISWDTFKGMDFLNNPVYMHYQFIVCMIFLVEYFYRFLISHHKKRFFILSLPFLIISIPYLNIINYFSWQFSPETLFCIRLIPLMRGLIALVMVVVFITEKLTTTVFASYVLVLVPIVYMSGLLFYMVEKQVNPAIKNFWYAQWWAGMSVTTIGCYINPVTATGMILGFILSLLGIIMFPLFTVYFGDVIQTFSLKYKKPQKREKEIESKK